MELPQPPPALSFFGKGGRKKKLSHFARCAIPLRDKRFTSPECACSTSQISRKEFTKAKNTMISLHSRFRDDSLLVFFPMSVTVTHLPNNFFYGPNFFF